MADRFPLILNTSTNQIQEIPSGDNLDLTGVGINNVGVITSGNVQIGAATTDLIVTGDARITGILTIGTDSITLNETANTINVGTALTLGHTQGLQFHTQNLHSAGFEVNQINVSGASTIGGNLDANGDLDVDGHTNLDNVNIVGVLTVTGAVNASHSTFGNLTALGLSLTNTNATINFNDTNNNPDYRVKADTGVFDVVQFNNGGSDINVVKVNTDGHIDIATNVDFAAGIDVTGNATVSGNLSVGGVLTYEDVTNVDSVGIVTAREGIQIPNDTYKLRSGAQLEMQVWHDGTNSIIKDTRDAGKVRIQADNFDIIDKDASTTVFSAAPGGINSPKLHTFSAGVNCTSTSAGAHQFATSGTPTTFAVTGQAEVTIGGGATKDNALAIESNTTAGLDYDSNIVLARSRGSHASKGIVQSGDFLGRVGFYGYDGSEYERAAEIAAIIDGTPGTNDMPTRLEFKTTPDGANVPTTKLKIAKTGNIHLPIDNQKLYFGADLDLEILHSGTTGVIDNNTGDLYIKTTGSGDDIIINSADDINLMVQNGEQAIAAYGNGGVELYYDNVKHFETISAGLNFAGSNADQLQWQKSNNLLKFRDGTKAVFGEGDDLQIHGGEGGTGAVINSANGDLFFRHGSEEQLILRDDGAVELYHDNQKKLETTSEGAKITTTAVNVAAKLEIEATNGGQPTLYLKASKSGTNRATRIDFLNQDSTTPKWTLINDFNQNGTNDFRITNTASSSQSALRAVNNGSLELHHAGTKKFETSSDGTKFSGSALFPDNQRIKVGGDASTPDFQIWHDGSHTRVSHTGTGQLIISGNDNDQVKLMKGNSEEGVILNNNGNVELYHNNTKRFETTDYGATIDGRLRCYALPQSTSATTPIALTLSSHTNAAEEGPYMVFNSKWMNGYDDWVVGAIAGIYETQSPGGSNAGAIVFRTNYNNNGAQGLGGTTEKMRIRGDGQVRIKHSANTAEIEHACLRVIKTGTSYADKTMISLENGDGTAGDLDYQTSHIDFSFFDTNTNVYPQVRISAHLGDGSNADSQVKEGKGWLSFHCSNTSAISGQANPQEHFRIKHNGDLLGTDTSIGSLCDSRLKKDITDYSYSLDLFKQFKPKTFNWINPDLHGKHTNQRGFIAQEVESIDSYFTDQAIVDEKIDDYNLVSDGLAKTTKLVEKDAMYISVIQQMIDKIEKLETEVAALKGS